MRLWGQHKDKSRWIVAFDPPESQPTRHKVSREMKIISPKGLVFVDPLHAWHLLPVLHLSGFTITPLRMDK